MDETATATGQALLLLLLLLLLMMHPGGTPTSSGTSPCPLACNTRIRKHTAQTLTINGGFWFTSGCKSPALSNAAAASCGMCRPANAAKCYTFSLHYEIFLPEPKRNQPLAYNGFRVTAAAASIRAAG
jgi:hypothetical protein